MSEMNEWQVKALEMLPELAEEIREAYSPMQLWLEISFEFKQAYDQVPRNEAMIERIYGFANWCVSTAQRADDAGNDPLTSVAVCFYEHLPKHPAARDDMPRWFTRDEIAGAKGIFGYLLSDAEFDALLARFPPEPAPARKPKKGR